ncbi:LicD family protein [Photobacterium piscicola]|uniref:LicD family protein n=1 Tax=Photobacterium piscicola TaxID=1378299 RepID=UPI0038D09FF7
MYLVKDNIEYYSIKNIKLIQDDMLEILDYISNISKCENIDFSLDGGTLIGAYRDSSIIPWDDDLDISLKKDDYLKLIRCINKDKNSNYYFFDESLNNGCCNFLAKKSNYFLKMKGRFFSYLIPPKVDIRPLNKIKKEDVRQNEKLRGVANYIIHGKLNNLNISEVEDIIKSYDTKSDFLFWYNNYYGLECEDGCVYSHPYFECSIDGEFGNEEIYPLDKVYIGKKEFNGFNESMLYKIYGNYKVLPPIQERKPVSDSVVKLNNISSKILHKSIYLHKNNINSKFYLCLYVLLSTALSKFNNIGD